MSDVSRYRVTPLELRRAFARFDQLNLSIVDYSGDPRLVSTMGSYTDANPQLSAGCETGIKLGLLIAEERATKK